MALKKTYLLPLIFYSVLSSASARADDLVIALGNFPPMFAKEGEPALFKDIIDGVYHYLPQHKVSYQYMVPNARLVVELNQKAVDGAANIFSQSEIKGCLTAPVFRFKDVAVTLKKNNYQLEEIADLAGKSIVSYQRAEHLLGEEFSAAVANSKYYQEVAEPMQQAKLLSSGLVDVSIGDKYIFLQSLKNWQKQSYAPNNLVFHEIFPPVYSRVGFNKQSLCDEFDQALATFKQHGEYEKIYDNYLKKLGYRSQ